MNLQHSGPKASDHSTASEVASVLNLAVGIYLLLTPWFYGTFGGSGAMWNSVVCGLAVPMLASAHVTEVRATWMSWVNAAIGVWVVFSPWVFGYSNQTFLMLNSVIIGIVILAISSFAIATSPRSMTR